MTENIHILGFAGSLRRQSFNRSLLAAAQEHLPQGVTLELFDLQDIPLYNGDDENGEIQPAPVLAFKGRIAAADALLIATPEYNYSVSGVLKNALDWASRPVATSPLNDKPVAIMGAGGMLGTSRAQYHLRQIAVHSNMHVLNKPEVMVAAAWQKFDGNGRLTDEPTRQRIGELLVALRDWTLRLKK